MLSELVSAFGVVLAEEACARFVGLGDVAGGVVVAEVGAGVGVGPQPDAGLDGGVGPAGVGLQPMVVTTQGDHEAPQV